MSLELGAGKKTKEENIDFTVGIKLKRLVGDVVKKGDIVATVYYGKCFPNINIDKIFTIN